MAPELLIDVRDTVVYFVLSLFVLLIGFGVLDLLTPGKLYRAVFVDHLPNAAIVAIAQQIGLGIIVVTAVLGSPESLIEGVTEVVVIGLLGVALQSIALVVLEMLIPGRFRDLVLDHKLRSGAIAAGVLLVVIAAVNAACLT
ncbi:hypothetical protein CKALI_01740 [Corynebacterium kalinowskii]|uniref:DUF350 domain-containing protein n=1 Tax=Corynebacterium kalinowskii TaxID=2675216 RepID=A0A6B8VNX3_9CORY|nr:DUF350 domain-containing protein [Corynebacterium kalinowskii]QGU01247.1 hypothetical protein CKALI_01740 [Corynebacterium kalinowskii]